MAKQLIHNTIKDFLDNVTDDDIYNEFSMQHELGINLREAFKTHNNAYNRNFVVQFERNRTYFGITAPKITKSEIDIVVYDKKGKQDPKYWEKYAIELKFPLKEQSKYPLHMYAFLEDIAFCEALVDNNNNNHFDAAFAATLINTHLYCGHNDSSICISKTKDKTAPYKYFRNAYRQDIPKGQAFQYKNNKKQVNFTMSKDYTVNWEDAKNISAVALKMTNQGKKGISNGKYYIIEIQ